jgi:hypothetical protein
MPPLPTGLPPGNGTVEANLVTMTRAALAFYQHSFPMMGSLLADPRLLAATRESLRAYGAGPQHANAWLAGYLKTEQDLGRVADDVDPDACAALLLGACFHQAFLRYYADGPDAAEPPDSTAVVLARTLARSLLPDRS